MKHFAFVLALSFIAPFASAEADLDAEVRKFVSGLNGIFHLEVRVRKDGECGFRLEPTSGAPEIVYCDEEIAYFQELEPVDRPLESLLTIVAHEYAHALLDHDVPAEVGKSISHSLAATAESIYGLVREDQERRGQLERFLAFAGLDGGTAPEKYALISAIEGILEGLADHENCDSLGAKLMLLLGHAPNPQVMQHLPVLSGDQSEDALNMVRARIAAIDTGAGEGLSSWSNFTCVAIGRQLPQSNRHLKTFLEEGNHAVMLAALTRECSQTEILETFYQALERYYPRD